MQAPPAAAGAPDDSKRAHGGGLLAELELRHRLAQEPDGGLEVGGGPAELLHRLHGLVGVGDQRGHRVGDLLGALGLGLHYVNATTISAVYHLAAARLPLLRERPLLAGAVYGIGVYVVMTHIVAPLSRAGRGSKDPLWIALSIAVHVLLVGIPIALIARRAFQG